MFGAGVKHDVVDGDVKRMLGQRCLDLVSRADQHLRSLDLLVHMDDVGTLVSGGGGDRRRFGLVG